MTSKWASTEEPFIFQELFTRTNSIFLYILRNFDSRWTGSSLGEWHVFALLTLKNSKVAFLCSIANIKMLVSKIAFLPGLQVSLHSQKSHSLIEKALFLTFEVRYRGTLTTRERSSRPKEWLWPCWHLPELKQKRTPHYAMSFSFSILHKAQLRSIVALTPVMIIFR